MRNSTICKEGQGEVGRHLLGSYKSKCGRGTKGIWIFNAEESRARHGLSLVLKIMKVFAERIFPHVGQRATST